MHCVEVAWPERIEPTLSPTVALLVPQVRHYLQDKTTNTQGMLHYRKSGLDVREISERSSQILERDFYTI